MGLSQEISLTQEIKSTQDDCKQNVGLADAVATLIQLATCWDREGGSETVRNSDGPVLLKEEDPSSCCICIPTSCVTIFQHIPFSQPQFQMLPFSTAGT